jgi:hypothetical protein
MSVFPCYPYVIQGNGHLKWTNSIEQIRSCEANSC